MTPETIFLPTEQQTIPLPEVGTDTYGLSPEWVIRRLPTAYTPTGPIYINHLGEQMLNGEDHEPLNGYYLFNKYSGKIHYTNVEELAAIKDLHGKRYTEIRRSYNRTAQNLDRLELLCEPGSTREINLSDKTSLAIWLKVNDKCMLACDGCFDGQANTIKLRERRTEAVPLEMSTATAFEIAKAISEAAYRNARNHCAIRLAGGEPSITPELCLEIIKIFKKQTQEKYISTTFSLVTNGIGLTSKFLQQLAEHDVHVILSMGGAKESHNKTRAYKGGQDSFEDVWRGLELIKQAGIKHNISVTLSKHNTENIALLADQVLKEFGWTLFHLNTLRDNQYGANSDRPTDQQLIVGLRPFYYLIYSYCLNNNIPFPWEGLQDYFSPEHASANICGAGFNYFSFNTAGERDTCHMLGNRGFKMQRGVNLFEAINQEHPIPLEHRLVTQRTGLCQTCDLAFKCKGGGCQLHQLFITGDYDPFEPPYCKTYKQLGYDIIDLRALVQRRILESNSEFKTIFMSHPLRRGTGPTRKLT